MTRSEQLRRLYEANLACGDIGEAAEARLLAEIAGAEAAEKAFEEERSAA